MNKHDGYGSLTGQLLYAAPQILLSNDLTQKLFHCEALWFFFDEFEFYPPWLKYQGEFGKQKPEMLI